MIRFNPYNVIMLLYETFTTFNLPQSPITSEEVDVKNKIEHMLQEIKIENEFEEEEEETLDFYNTYKIPKVEKVDLLEENEDTVYLPAEVICSSVEEAISSEYKRQAVEYWRNGKIKPRSFEGIRKSFRKVTLIRQLRRWQNQIDRRW